MNFSQFLTVQSWWEVPSIAYFCSLFRTAFKLLDFDIEELEEALLADGLEESASSLLTELIVRLLNGCLGNNDISAFNYQMYLRRIFRQKCQETSRYNPFNTDIDFQFLPLRTKVEILYALCDFRLDAEDVLDLFKNLEAESLRVEPLGFDDECSAYWYFYGTRLYREDLKKKKGKHKRKKKESGKCWFYGDDYLDEDDTERVWQVVCFTEADWIHLTERFSRATSKVERELYRSLSQNFLPEIPRLFQEKERLQRKRLLETAPRRTSNRVLQKIKQKEESKQSTDDNKDGDDEPQPTSSGRANRAKRRNLIRSKSESSSSSESAKEMPQKVAKRRAKSQDKKRSKNSSATHKGEPPPDPPAKSGRKTNNSLASATGQIVIPDNDEPGSSTRKKLKTSQIFSRSEEDIKTDMYKVLEQITAHDDAWPFMEPVEEEYAPNYYAVIRRPMDLHKMEDRLDSGHYRDFTAFKADFKLIVNNCRLYNGQDNEYTVMVDNLAAAFDRLTEKYMHRLSSSDEEIAVEFQIPTPSRKHKPKRSESPQVPQKKRKRKSHSESEPKSSSSDLRREHASEPETAPQPEKKKSKESHKNRDGKGKKKRKGHRRRGKHSKRRRESRSGEGDDMEREERRRKKQKSKNKEKRARQKKKKSRHHEPPSPAPPSPVPVARVPSPSAQSVESSNRSRSASPLPSIRSESPPPSLPDEPPPDFEPDDQLSDPDFFKDKYDKIKERRRGAAKDVWESLFDYKQKCALDKLKHLAPTETDKNLKLRETIEKLKAKHTEKYKETPATRDLFSPTHGKSKKKDKDGKSKEKDKDGKSKEKDKDGKSKETKSKEPKLKESKSKEPKSKESKLKESKTKESKTKEPKSKNSKTKNKHAKEKEDNVEDDEDAEDDEPIKKPAKAKPAGKRGPKKSSAKNESATEALEEAVKDMTKWFEDGPKGSAVSSPADSPAQTISTEEQDSRQDDEVSLSEKTSTYKKDHSSARKRHASREPKVLKRREIQRTIDRLQPGKSKGNLITKVIKKDVKKDDEKEESASPGAVTKARETSKSEEASPKLSLGSVLPTVDFTLGKEHKFGKKETKVETATATVDIAPKEEVKAVEFVEKKVETVAPIEKKEEVTPAVVTKKDAEVETEPQPPIKPNQATPNLSAWFKAFGAPKSTPPVIGFVVKKKVDEGEEEKPAEPAAPEVRVTSPANPETPNTEGGESPLPNPTATPRQRRTSTGSSVSERSSFSQDLDSPRHQMSLTSPLLRSPASPRDDFQKITYPIINGSVRAGFYQDTTSIRSSPEKSCSPREGPTSPYSPYNQHVYAGNHAAGSATPQYFVDHNKSPLPTYTQNPPPFYDTAKAAAANKPRAHEDYTALGPDTFQPNPIPRSYSPVYSPYTQTSSNYPLVQNPPLPISSNTTYNVPPVTVDTKSANFPMKKRMYNEPEQTATPPTKPAENKEANVTQNKIELPKPVQSTPVPPTSVDDIALALSEKSELAKLREKNAAENTANNERLAEERDTAKMEQVDTEREIKKDANTNGTKPFGNVNNDNIDMVNMGYMNPEYERRISGENRDNDFSAMRDKPKPNANSQHKVYDVDTIALNLGINNQPLHKTLAKNTMQVPPAHSHVRMEQQQPALAHTQPPHTQPPPHSQQPAHSQHLTHSQHPIHSQHPSNSQPAHSQPAHSQHTTHAQPAHTQHPVHSQHPAHSQPAHSQHASHSQGSHSQHVAHSQQAHSQQAHSQPAHSQPAHCQPPAHSQSLAHSQQNARAQTPAHERSHSDMNINQHAAHSHHLSHYEHLTGGQALSNFSMSDIELANKKLYSSNNTPPSTAIDYGNWKLSQMRKQEMLTPSDYSATYQHSVNQNDKHKQDIMMSSTYNKNLQQQYNIYNVPRANSQRTQDLQQSLPAELRIPNPRGHLKNDHNLTTSVPSNDPETTNKHIDTASKNHKADKLVQNHPLVTSNPYKTPYSNPALQLDSLRNLQNIPQMLERYSNEERFLSSFASSSSLYDKQFQMAQMFNKSMASEIPSSSAAASIYSQPSMSLSKDCSIYKSAHGANPQPEPKPKQKRKKRTSESKSAQISTIQPSYHAPSCTADMLSSVKSGMMPTSSFNFGTSTNMATNMALSSGMYGDNAGFSAANQLMAANYMVAAVAHQQRTSAEASVADKLGKPAHQAARDAFPFIGHGQVRPGYGFVGSGVGVEPGSPLYQQYLQRQEELLRQTGAQIMGLYPPGYPPSLGVSQPYDTINMNRHSWL